MGTASFSIASVSAHSTRASTSTVGAALRQRVAQAQDGTAVRERRFDDVDKLALSFKKMTEDKSVTVMIKQLGDRMYYLGPDDFSKLWREEYEYHKECSERFLGNRRFSD